VVGNNPSLIINEQEGSNSFGSIIELFPANNKLIFKINEAAAKKQNLDISQKLLNMANQIIIK